MSSSDELVNLIGSPKFMSAVHARIRSLPGFPWDPIILASILHCLTAGDSHLLLRTSEEDVSLYVRLVALTLTSLFGLSVHKLKLRKPSNTEEEAPTAAFLRSLFFSAPPTSHDEAKRFSFPRTKAHARSRSLNPHKTRSNYTRSVSYPNELASINSSELPAGNKSTGGTHQSSTSVSLKLPTFPHAHTDPTPLVSLDPFVFEVPNALVISGLEHASFVSQKALTRVLTEKKIVLPDHEDGVWNLPETFLVVYVCSMDTRERPLIHKTLLDKFSMSATVALQPAVRSLVNSWFLHPMSPPGTWSQGHTPTSTPKLGPRGLPSTGPEPQESMQVIPPSLINHLRRAFHRTYLPPVLNLYTSDLFSAARHHPQLEGRLLGAKARKDADTLARAARVLGGEPSGMELLKEWAPLRAQESGSSQSTFSKLSDSGESGIFQRLGFEEIMGDITRNVPPIGGTEKTNSLATYEPEEQSTNSVPILEVSAADIARIVPRVMSHRLRVRDGPQGEVLGSAVFGATYPTRDQETSRSTCKDILVSILAGV
ncbi:hypothetical protein C8J56DRAFT_926997 [Mycena floridula]|nr:hypothetical protein C8J56DRAFT_926997 [Mycena floridula]